jgi:hypothetical protein
VHEDVTVLGKSARLERAIVIFLKLAEPAPEPALGRKSGAEIASSGSLRKKTLYANAP